VSYEEEEQAVCCLVCGLSADERVHGCGLCMPVWTSLCVRVFVGKRFCGKKGTHAGVNERHTASSQGHERRVSTPTHKLFRTCTHVSSSSYDTCILLLNAQTIPHLHK